MYVQAAAHLIEEGMRTRWFCFAVFASLVCCGSSPAPEKSPAIAPKTEAAALSSANEAKTAAPAENPAAPDSNSSNSTNLTANTMPTTFEDEAAFLKRFGDVLLLESPEGGRILVSAKYQGRVMTSAVAAGGQSLGWINHGFIESQKTGTQFDNYGGEDRFWLGPEGGQFGLYFPPGKPFAFSYWQTPAGFQEGEWKVVSKDGRSVGFQHSMQVSNNSGTKFDLDVERRVGLLSKAEVEKQLGLSSLPSGVKWVSFASENTIKNTGKQAWSEKGGLLSIWILAMFQPAADMHVLVPFQKDGKGPIVNDTYFGKVPGERLRVDSQAGVLAFRCDGKYRSKIGLSPERAKNILGSYSASGKLLTIVQYDKPKVGGRYVNSLWETQKNPFEGDVVNSYNDGPTEPGKPALGGFYEMETSSPGAALKPGAALSHAHRTFHFMGDEKELNAISEKVLGAPLSAFKSAP